MKLRIRQDDWIEVEEREPGVFTVVGDSMTIKDGNWLADATALGFDAWDGEVENLDFDSDEFQCFGMSAHLKWQDVDLTPKKFRAPSLERLQEAIDNVVVIAWCPGDI